MVLCGYRISFCFYTDSYHNQDLQRHLNHNLYCRKMKTDFKVNDSNYVGYRKKICVQFFYNICPIFYTINTIDFRLLSLYEVALLHC